MLLVLVDFSSVNISIGIGYFYNPYQHSVNPFSNVFFVIWQNKYSFTSKLSHWHIFDLCHAWLSDLACLSYLK